MRGPQIFAVGLYIDEAAALREVQRLGSISKPAPNPEAAAFALLNGQFRCAPFCSAFAQLLEFCSFRQFGCAQRSRRCCIHWPIRSPFTAMRPHKCIRIHPHGRQKAAQAPRLSIIALLRLCQGLEKALKPLTQCRSWLLAEAPPPPRGLPGGTTIKLTRGHSLSCVNPYK